MRTLILLRTMFEMLIFSKVGPDGGGDGGGDEGGDETPKGDDSQDTPGEKTGEDGNDKTDPNSPEKKAERYKFMQNKNSQKTPGDDEEIDLKDLLADDPEDKDPKQKSEQDRKVSETDQKLQDLMDWKENAEMERNRDKFVSDYEKELSDLGVNGLSVDGQGAGKVLAEIEQEGPTLRQTFLLANADKIFEKLGMLPKESMNFDSGSKVNGGAGGKIASREDMIAYADSLKKKG